MPKAHQCHLACGYCGFCVHTFRCSCNENKFHGEFCIHLHSLSSVRQLMPNFELPINAQLQFFHSIGKYLNILDNGDPATVSQRPSEQEEEIVNRSNKHAGILQHSCKTSPQIRLKDIAKTIVDIQKISMAKPMMIAHQ